MKTSKFLGLKSGDWTCTHVGLASITSAFSQRRKVNGKPIRNKTSGHRNYYYIFERLTSDNKAMKMVRLSAAQASKVWKGLQTVEYFSELKEAQRSQDFKKKVSYSFCD
mgnify:CR=1 FL=1